MDFEQRLQKAIERGQKVSSEKSAAQAQNALSEDELKSLHSRYRLQLSEHIEECLRKTADHFPGFRFNSLVSEGWGASIHRDDVARGIGGRPSNFYSRLEIVVRPYSPVQIVELVGKATIRNKEIFNRSHFQRLTEVDIDTLMGLVDAWVLEFAELYAAQR